MFFNKEAKKRPIDKLQIDEHRKFFRSFAGLILNPHNWSEDEFVAEVPPEFQHLKGIGLEQLLKHIRQEVFAVCSFPMDDGSRRSSFKTRIVSWLMRTEVNSMMNREAPLRMQEALRHANYVLNYIYEKFLPKDLPRYDVANLSLKRSIEELQSIEAGAEYKRQIRVRLACAALSLSSREIALSEDPEEAYSLAWEAIKKEIPMSNPIAIHIASWHKVRHLFPYFCESAMMLSREREGANFTQSKVRRNRKFILTEDQARFALLGKETIPVIVSSRSKDDSSAFLKEMRLCLSVSDATEEIKDMYGLKIVVPQKQHVDQVYHACLQAIKKHYPEAQFLDQKDLYHGEKNENTHSAVNFRNRDVVVMLGGQHTKLFEFQVMTLPDYVNSEYYARDIRHDDYVLRRFYAPNRQGVSLAQAFTGRKFVENAWQDRAKHAHAQRVREAIESTGKQDLTEFSKLEIREEEVETLKQAKA